MAKIRSLDSLVGTRVVNLEGEDLGKIEEMMIDLEHGSIAYAVLSFGGLLGFGDKLFAVPWESLSLDQGNERMLLNVPRARLKEAKGFDKFDWPNVADPALDADPPPEDLPSLARANGAPTPSRTTVAP